MTYDSSVFSRGNYYKDSFYFISKIQKDFGIYLLLIFRYIAKKNVPCCFERDNPSGRQPHPLPN